MRLEVETSPYSLRSMWGTRHDTLSRSQGLAALLAPCSLRVARAFSLSVS